MKRILRVCFLCSFLMVILSIAAFAAADTTIRVGLRYGSTAMATANLQNSEGSGYLFGYMNGDAFVSLGSTGETKISMEASGKGESGLGTYHVQLPAVYSSFSAASAAAQSAGGFPAYVNGNYYVRVGSYASSSQADAAKEQLGGDVADSSSTGVTVIITGTQTILFQFDCSGVYSLTVQPTGAANPVTLFQSYKYNGLFQYLRTTGGSLSVINIVDLDDYVKGVVPYEMSASWPIEALKAQAVCARTYVSRLNRHSGDGFDICSTTHCQVYYGRNRADARSDQAVDETAGICAYYNGKLIEAVYSSSNGGASEDAKNVWGGDTPYLKGKLDPYEAMITIPNYQYTVTFSAQELEQILAKKGKNIGTVTDLYVSEFTALGNVKEVTFVGTSGTHTVKQESCRTFFNGVISGKSVRSLRYTITGGSGGAGSGSFYVNPSGGTVSLPDSYVISGDGTVSPYSGSGAWVITDQGLEQLTTSGGGTSSGGAASSGSFTITGTGYGHNVGLSQYGAKAMAENGYTYDEILKFYYTGIELK